MYVHRHSYIHVFKNRRTTARIKVTSKDKMPKVRVLGYCPKNNRKMQELADEMNELIEFVRGDFQERTGCWLHWD